jgi:hypothetical protein
MSGKTIKDLFANDISRRIEEVIKVDQADEQIIRDELAEYVVTDSIRSHFTDILERYWETPRKPHEGIAVWVSGFFGSGKSSFAKYLGLALENRDIMGEGAAQIFGQRTGDQKVQVLLSSISEQIRPRRSSSRLHRPRHSHRQPDHHGLCTGCSCRAWVMPRPRPLRARITLEEEGRLDAFKAKYQEIFEELG